MNPAAVEIYDGVDNDCDGYDLSDVDGDGYDWDGVGGDCNDGDAMVSLQSRFPMTVWITTAMVQTSRMLMATAMTGWASAVMTARMRATPCILACRQRHPMVDEDCDGSVDEETTLYDDDGDGYSETGGDCDDADSGAHPALSRRSTGPMRTATASSTTGPMATTMTGMALRRPEGDCATATPPCPRMRQRSGVMASTTTAMEPLTPGRPTSTATATPSPRVTATTKTPTPTWR